MREIFIPLRELFVQQPAQKKHHHADFSHWDETNPCFGCGRCCSNVRLELSVFSSGSEQFGQLYPHVVNPDEPMELCEVPKNEPGVYYAIGKSGKHYLVIVGDCPELNEDKSCNIHDQERPLGCSASGLESLKCITSRKKH